MRALKKHAGRVLGYSMDDAYQKPGSVVHATLAELAIENRIITRSDLAGILNDIRSEKQNGRHLSFENALLERGLVDRDTLTRLIAATVRSIDKKFADLAEKQGLASRHDLAKALEIQKESFKKGVLVSVGDLLVKSHHLTAEQRDFLLKSLDGHAAAPPPSAEKTPSAPSPEDTHNSPLALIITANGLRADIQIPEGLSRPPGLSDIRDLVASRGLRFGVIGDQDIQNHLARIGTSPGSFVVAMGIPALPARDAAIRIFFLNDYLNPGKITDHGSIDFKDRGMVPFVKTGVVLAEKIPGVDGKPGTDIFGNLIPSDKAVDQPLKSGSGTVVSDDGLKILAALDGQPLMTVHGEVTVMKELHIPGDVDYTTGNIIFNGSIIVKGSINPGFLIKGGALTAKDVNGAEIDVAGNIEISGGIMDSVLRAGGAVLAMHMSGTKVDAYGDVLVKKEVVDCKIRTSGAFNGETVRIVSSLVSAKKGILARQIGTDVSRPCTLRVGISDHTEKKVLFLRSEIEDRKKELELEQKKKEEVQNAQKQLHKDIMDQVLVEDKLQRQKTAIESFIETLKANTQLTEKAAAQLKKLEEGRAFCESEMSKLASRADSILKQQDAVTYQILDLQGRCEDLVGVIEGLHERIREIRTWDKKTPPLAQIQVHREIFTQTLVSGPNSMLIVKETCRNVTIRESRRSDLENDWEMKIETL